MKSIDPKNNNQTQVVVSSDKTLFLITKVLSSTNVVCPFNHDEGEYYTNFSAPKNRIYRIQALYNTVSKISTYSINESQINFDCVNQLPVDLFQNAMSGFIHFTTSIAEEDVVEIDPKIIFKNVDPVSEDIKLDQSIKFRTKFLKVFPIILTNGFMLSIADQDEATIFISVNNPEKNIVGSCLRQEIINTIQNIVPIWPIFNINVGKTTKIYLRENILPDNFKENSQPILINITYRFDDTRNATIIKTAESI